MPDPQMSSTEFAAKIKAKYPDYANIPDTELVAKMITKYPEYRDKVSFGAPQTNYSSMSPQDLAAQAMRSSGISQPPMNRPVPSLGYQGIQPVQPSAMGAVGNAAASVGHELFSPSGSVGRFHKAFEQDLGGAIQGVGGLAKAALSDPNGNPTYAIGRAMVSPIVQSANDPNQSGAETLGVASGINSAGIKQAAQNQDYASILGHSTLPLAGAMMAGRKIGESAPELNPFPSRARAGETFANVEKSAGDIPIDVNKPGEVALRTQELASSGGSMPKVVRDFIRRVTNPDAGPLTYSEARDFYSNATRLSADEFNRLTPVMKKQVGEFTSSLNDSITGAAEQAGKKAEYLDAMGEYAAASRWRNRAAMLGKVAQKTVPYVAAGYVGKKIVEGR